MAVREKHRKSLRLKRFDYSQVGAYFVTICTKNRVHLFGKIDDDQMALNDFGRIVEQQWLWLSHQYEYVGLDEFIVMPNHLHGILSIVGNGRDRSLPNDKRVAQQKTKSLPELIGAFKTTSSKLIHVAGGFEFQWQKSYYDHIIRNEYDLYRIREYIINNPLNWDTDENYN